MCFTLKALMDGDFIRNPHKMDAPVIEAPTSAGKAVISEVRSTIIEAPVVEAPITEAPDVEAPITEVPDVEAPIIDAPDAEAPIIEDHIIEAPAVEAPIIEAHIIEVPVVEDPIIDQVLQPGKKLIQKDCEVILLGEIMPQMKMPALLFQKSPSAGLRGRLSNSPPAC